MENDSATASTDRLERRRARTRAALLRAGQTLLAQGRTGVPVQEITALADVGVGTFYNHFDSKEELFEASLEQTLEEYGNAIDAMTADEDDPAVAFATGIRVVGRLHRRNPEESRILLRHGLELIQSPRGLAPRAMRDLQAAVDAGRLSVKDTELALSTATGALLALGSLLLAQPERDVATSTDQVATDILTMFGMGAEEAADICSRALPDVVLSAE